MERPRVRVPATVQAFCILSTSTQLASIHFKGSAHPVPRMDPGGPWSGVLGPDLGKPIGSAPIFRLDPSQYTLLAITVLINMSKVVFYLHRHYSNQNLSARRQKQFSTACKEQRGLSGD